MKDFAKSIRTNNVHTKVGNANQVYTDSDMTIYDDGTVKIDYFKGYTQKIGDVPSIVRDEISALKMQIAELERVEKKAKEYKGKIGNRKVGNSSKFDALESIIQEASMYAENAYRRLNSPYSATNIISDLSHCKQACDIAIKRAQEYDKELQAKK